ncbi:MAG: ribonuclease III [Spirochaetia bacterium]
MFTQRRRDNFVALNPERKKELQLFEKHARIRFRRLEFLNQAFTHRSFAHEAGESGENNERLEFLGDSVLGLVVAEYVYATLPDQPEGELARIKSFVVSEASLSEIARGLRVDNFILIGKGEEYSGGRSKKTILADCLEAIIGAYYLDCGFPAAERFVHAMLVPEINKVLENRHAKDYKTLLQEWVQKRMKTYPKYRVVQKTGPDHDKTFWIEVHVGERSFGAGKGKNKKEAEQEAARLAWESMTGGDKGPRPEKSASAARSSPLPKADNRPPRR